MRITVAFVLSLIGAGSASNIVARGGYDGWKPKTKEPHFFQLKVDEFESCLTYSLDSTTDDDLGINGINGLNSFSSSSLSSSSVSNALLQQAIDAANNAAAAAAAAAAPAVAPNVASAAAAVPSVAAGTVGSSPAAAAAAPPASSPLTPAAGTGALPAPPSKRQVIPFDPNADNFFCFKNYAIRLNKGVVIATPYSKFWDPPLATFFVDDDTQLYTVSKKPLQLYVDAVTGQLKYTRVGWLPPNSISISFYHTGDNPLGIVNGNSPSLLTWPSTPGIARDDGSWWLCPDGQTGQFTVYVNEENFASQGTSKMGCVNRKLAAVNANPWKKKSHGGKYNDGYEDSGYDSGYDNEYEKDY